MMASKEESPLLILTNQTNQNGTHIVNGTMPRRSYSERDMEGNFLENSSIDRGCESLQHERERLFDEKNG